MIFCAAGAAALASDAAATASAGAASNTRMFGPGQTWLCSTRVISIASSCVSLGLLEHCCVHSRQGNAHVPQDDVNPLPQLEGCCKRPAVWQAKHVKQQQLVERCEYADVCAVAGC